MTGLVGLLRCAVLALVLVGVSAGSGCRPEPYACVSDKACVLNGVAGQCAAGSRCAFPDDQCPSGFRYANDPDGQRQPCAPARGMADADAIDAAPSCSWSGLASGKVHSCVLRNVAATDGSARLFCFGDNADGQLGDGTLVSRSSSVAVATPSAPIAIAAGSEHTCVLDAQHAVWCSGSNAYGQLGIEGVVGSTAARAVPGAVEVEAVVAGANHTCILRHGAVACWGDNRRRQLALNGQDESVSPVAIASLPKITALTAGDAFTCALAADGQVWCWGDNVRNQIASGTTPLIPTPTRRSDVVDAKQIVAGGRFVCVVTPSLQGGQVRCWGENQDGQTGRPVSTREAEAALVPGLPAVREILGREMHTPVQSPNSARCTAGAGETRGRLAPVVPPIVLPRCWFQVLLA